MSLAKIQKQLPLYVLASDQLREAITTGQLKPGQRLTDNQLAEWLGISRTPVREAVRTLVKEGLLVGDPASGVTVFEPTPRDVAEVYAVRATLESLAFALVAARNERELLVEELELLLADTQQAIEQGEHEKIKKYNAEFHRKIVEASHSQLIISLLNPIAVKMQVFRHSSLLRPRHVEISIAEHQRILDLIRRGDVVECKKVTENHIIAAGRRMVEAMFGGKGPQSDLLVEAFVAYVEKTAADF